VADAASVGSDAGSIRHVTDLIQTDPLPSQRLHFRPLDFLSWCIAPRSLYNASASQEHNFPVGSKAGPAAGTIQA
jgi:hypothetical protein